MNQTLMPERYLLDQTQLAAAISLSGRRPGPTSPLPDLTPVADAVGALSGTALLNGSGLTPQAQAAMAALSTPQRQLTVRVSRVGQPVWQETNLVQGADEPVAAFSVTGEKWDLALLPTTLQAALMVNELLALTTLPSVPGGRVIELDLIGYTALMAVADVLQAARLGARLSRESRPLPLLTGELLEGMLDKGLNSADTRWAVTAARLATPTDLRPVQGKMNAGLQVLAATDLLITQTNGWALTHAGGAVAAALGELINTGSLTLAVASEADDQVTVAHAGIFRSSTEIWLATWSAWGPGEGTVKLRHVSGSSAVRFVAGLLAPS